MTIGDLKRELKNFKGLDNWEVNILIEELPDRLLISECTKIGVCINDKCIVLGTGKCPHCEGE